MDQSLNILMKTKVIFSSSMFLFWEKCSVMANMPPLVKFYLFAGSVYSPGDPLLISEQGEVQDGHYFIKVSSLVLSRSHHMR